MNDRADAGSIPQRLRKHYLPITEVEPGMVLGEAVFVTERKLLRYSLPAGTN